jgi:peptidoglycan/xylan/chitin deacetylase (PgdA/CDA1 family)
MSIGCANFRNVTGKTHGHGKVISQIRLVLCVFTLFFCADFALSANERARFLLSFDDGPSTREVNNPSETILDVLAENPIQNGIKAVFFTQTRLDSGSHAEHTRRILQREADEGHLLAIHSGVLKSHSDHRGLKNTELEEFLSGSKSALQRITGLNPLLIRPSFWAFNERTLAMYAKYDLHMLLTDVSVSDGKSWGYRANPRRRSVLRMQLKAVHQRIADGLIPAVDGLLPIVVAFHDTNTWTAEHMTEYLQLLVTAAGEAGIILDEQPFYTQRDQLSEAGVQRSLQEEHPVSMVPLKWRVYVSLCIWPICHN